MLNTDILKAAMLSTTKHDSRPFTQGVHLTKRMVETTDGHRFFRFYPTGGTGLDGECVLEVEGVSTLLKVAPKSKCKITPVCIYCTESYPVVQTEANPSYATLSYLDKKNYMVDMKIRLIEGTFPNIDLLRPGMLDNRARMRVPEKYPRYQWRYLSDAVDAASILGIKERDLRYSWREGSVLVHDIDGNFNVLIMHMHNLDWDEAIISAEDWDKQHTMTEEEILSV